MKKSFFLSLGLARLALPARDASDLIIPRLDKAIPGFRTTMSLLAKSAVGFTYQINMNFVQEGFPTLLRAR